LRLLHALAVEAERRGYHVSAIPVRRDAYGRDAWSSSRDGHLVFELRGHTYPLRLLEEGLTRSNPWERPRRALSGSGRLRIEVDHGYSREGRQCRWADRTRVTLDQRLPDVLRELELRCAALKTITSKPRPNGEPNNAAGNGRRQWQEAMAKAEADLIESNRADHLLAQADRWRTARRLRDYLDHLQTAIAAWPDVDQANAAREWLAWAHTYVERIDPLTTPPSMPPPPEVTQGTATIPAWMERLQPRPGESLVANSCQYVYAKRIALIERHVRLCLTEHGISIEDPIAACTNTDTCLGRVEFARILLPRSYRSERRRLSHAAGNLAEFRSLLPTWGGPSVLMAVAMARRQIRLPTHSRTRRVPRHRRKVNRSRGRRQSMRTSASRRQLASRLVPHAH
jgi:hypothetical protein